MKQLTEGLFDAYYRDVYSYLYSLCRDPSLAEDLASEVFLETLRSIHSFRGESDVKTWLFSIARHRWQHHLRKINTRPQTELLTEFLPDRSPLPEDTVIRRQLLRRVLELINTQPERTASILRMRLEGCSFHEIGLRHGISEQSARVIDFRAKTKIRTILKQEGLTDD